MADLFPLTPLGVAACAGAAWALRSFAYAELDLVLLVLGWAAVGMASLSLVSVLVATPWLKWVTRGVSAPALSMETGRPTKTGVSVPSLRWVPLLLVHVELLEPEDLEGWGAPEGGRLWEQLVAQRRGEVRRLVRRVVVSDAFGLARLAFRIRGEAEVDVLPHVGALNRMPLLSSFAGGDERPHPMGVADGDRVELRKYAPGDPARFIHWKVFSRTRKLVVRVPERALTLSRRTVAYLVSGPVDQASAAAARVSVEAGVLGEEWVFGADGSAGQTSDPAEALSRIVRSAGQDVQGGQGLARYVALAEREGPATLVVFVPAAPGPWLAPVVAVLRARRGRARAVIGVDGLRRSDKRPWWKHAMSRPLTPVGVDEAVLSEVRVALARAGADVLVVDRLSGRLLGKGGVAPRLAPAEVRAA
ncbi:MAG: DUF58 domain-containing protein [Deltaproteobacteria bacterium]|nr:DUF58 domain-containing protein [Deltaproteobacteria bacterium]